MNLHDPQRPTLPNGRVCWLRGNCAIARPSVSVLPDGRFRVGMMLPLAYGDFVSRECHTPPLDAQELLHFFTNFAVDPEQTCEALWASEGLELRKHTHRCEPTAVKPRRPSASAVSVPELEITF